MYLRYCSERGDTVGQTNVLSFARIIVVYLPELGGQLPSPDPPSRTPMVGAVVASGTRARDETIVERRKLR